MKTVDNKKPKDRIVEISAKLFYDHDANTIGVDRISEVANVSKRTLYKYFPSKEALVSAALGVRANEWAEEFIDTKSDDPVERIRHIFKTLELNAESEDFHGCPMMNTSIELRDSNDLAAGSARDFKGGLYSYFKEQATLIHANDPGALAEQLVVLYDGCNAWIVMRRQFPRSAYAALDMLLKT